MSDVDDELDRIQVAHGGMLRAEDVVDFARDDRTALHARFEWDDDVAGHEWRLEQARRIIRFRVTYVDTGDGEPVRVRMHVSLPNDRVHGGGYRNTVDVLSVPDLRKQLLESAKRDMQAFKDKYGLLAELAGVFEAMDRTQKPRRRKRRTAGKA